MGIMVRDNWTTVIRTYTSDHRPFTYDEQDSTFSIPDAQKIRLALAGSLFAEFRVSDNISLGPTIGMDYSLTKIKNDINWTASSLYAGLTLRYIIPH